MNFGISLVLMWYKTFGDKKLSVSFIPQVIYIRRTPNPRENHVDYVALNHMGVATGRDGGDVSPPPGLKFRGMYRVPPEIVIF